jgi:hypothetical protein
MQTGNALLIARGSVFLAFPRGWRRVNERSLKSYLIGITTLSMDGLPLSRLRGGELKNVSISVADGVIAAQGRVAIRKKSGLYCVDIPAGFEG